jgi:two-component system sensor histidine kinase DegS
MGEIESNFEQFSIELESEYEQTQRTLHEVEMMLDQSQAELSKLTKRNTSVTAHLQQIQNQFESVPRSDIRLAYNSALDAQQRVLVMRSQLEKLQADQTSLKKRIGLIEQIRGIFSLKDLPSSRKKENGGGGSATLEMMINSQETERQRLSRQMHDGPAQALSNFIVQAEIAARLFDLDQTKAKQEMENLKNSAMSTFQKVRNFITELRPMMLDDLGLIPTIKRYNETFAEQNGIEINTNIKGNGKRFEPYLEIMVFRALQELIGNATRHNQDISVKLQVNVQIIMDDNFVKMIVQDNGKGFDVGEAVEKSGLGLKVIKERVEILGGYIDIDSAPGQGSRITVQIPISSISEEKVA